MGLKPWNDEDEAEGMAIIKAFADSEDEGDDDDNDEHFNFFVEKVASNSTEETDKPSGDAGGSSAQGDKDGETSKK
jgi:hypothetical protein